MVVAVVPAIDFAQGHCHPCPFLSAGQAVVLEEEHAVYMHLVEHVRDLVQGVCDSLVLGSDISLVLGLDSIGHRHPAAAELSMVLLRAVLDTFWA